MSIIKFYIYRCIYETISSDSIIFLDETLTTLIHQRGEIQCTFGGGVDWCFTQYTKYDKADWNLSDVGIVGFLI